MQKNNAAADASVISVRPDIGVRRYTKASCKLRGILPD